MNARDEHEDGRPRETIERDPLGLRGLPRVKPPEDDGWEQIRAALLTVREERRAGRLSATTADPGSVSQPASARWTRPLGWALAASLVLAIGVFGVRQQAPTTSPAPDRLAAEETNADSEIKTPVGPGDTPLTPAEPATSAMTMDSLVSLSQRLERRIREVRAASGPLSGEAAIYVAEIEDTIARVDGALSGDPDSVDLWGQRVNLLLDLQAIYLHHWESDYRWLATR